ncbi:SGNH/GDSL hydrolase family protein [Verrucomicrobiales bacterium BCK34]|nr:SGNH/GDSL hydrolase family protein [Verrucomicrobiales bacterium BCK34]
MYHPITFRKFAATIFVIALGIGVGSAQQKGKKKPVKRPNPAMAEVKDVAGLPRVLLIGDSISIGYTVPVRELMAGKANVHRPLTNCGPTTVGLAALSKWLETGGADKKWDVIHFNWGLHDLKYLGPDGANLQDPAKPENHQQVPPGAYRDNLVELVKRLKETGATLIWRNTTPVPEGARGRVVGDSVKYNGIAAEVMKEAGIETHDLYSFAKERQAEIQKEADVHFTAPGYKALAEDVVRVISAALTK